MGTDKAWLPFGAETMLQRVVRILQEAVEPVIVVAAATTLLPELPADVRIVFDRYPERGPLEGLAAGLAALADVSVSSNSTTAKIAAAFVTSCDAPLLLPGFVRRMVELLESADVAVPKVEGRLHPLAAVYRLTVLPDVERRLAADQLRLTELVDDLRARIVVPEELREIDPQLQSLRNVNDQEAYRAALLES
jgi:molybdopterin-guanine dinucleotide biosynthesis protein A